MFFASNCDGFLSLFSTIIDMLSEEDARHTYAQITHTQNSNGLIL